MLSISNDRNDRRQDATEQNQPKPIAAKPESEEHLLETKEVLTELKPPPRAKETVVNGNQVRNSYSSINQEAAVVERVVRESGLDHGISSDQMMADLTLAKNYVVDSGRQDIETARVKPAGPGWEDGLKNSLTHAQAIERGIPISEMIPSANSLKDADRMSNASPQAQQIAQTNGIQIPESMQIAMIQAIAQSQNRLLHGHSNSYDAPMRGNTFESTYERIRDFAANGASAESLVINGQRIRQEVSVPTLAA